MADVAFLGLGAMGSRMAANLITNGHTVTVWNRSYSAVERLAALGARRAETPCEAARSSEFVITMVRDDPASKEVWLDPTTGALKGLSPSAVAIESSTVSTTWSRELGRVMSVHGRAFLEAPVSGSTPQAEAATLIYLVGGDEAFLARAAPVLGAMGSAIHHTGPIGSGALLKLAVNSLMGLQVAGWAELIGMLDRAGIDVVRAVNIIGATAVASPGAKANAALMVEKRHAPLFTAELIEKDLTYAVRAAHGADHLPVAEATRRVFARAVGQGFGADNLTGIVRLYRA